MIVSWDEVVKGSGKEKSSEEVEIYAFRLRERAVSLIAAGYKPNLKQICFRNSTLNALYRLAPPWKTITKITGLLVVIVCAA